MITTEVLLTGATDYLGRPLALRLIEAGYTLRTLTRRDWEGPPMIPSERRHLGTLPDSIPPACLRGVHTVVHAAATTGSAPESQRYAVNVAGSRVLAEMAAEAGVRRFVHISSIVAHPESTSAYDRSKYDGEEAVCRCLAMSGTEVIILRPGVIVGPGMSELLPRLRRLVRRRRWRPILVGVDALPWQLVHVDDVGTAVLAVLAGRVEGPCVLTVADPQALSMGDLLRRLAAIEGRRPTIVDWPSWWPSRRRSQPAPPGAVDTRDDLTRLGIRLRPLDETLREARSE